jgi:DNA-binding CsgD family transcriptional regulator
MNASDKKEKLSKFIFYSQAVLEQMPEIVFLKNIDFTYAGVNSHLVDFSRLGNRGRILGQKDSGLPWAEGAKIYREIDKAVLAGTNKKTIIEVRVGSGEKVTAIQNKNLIRDPLTKEPIGIMATMTELDVALLERFSSIQSRDKKVFAQTGTNLTNYRIEEYNGYSLTGRESQCLFLLLRGFTTKKIALSLDIQPTTADKFINNVRQKFGCNYKTDLVERAIKKGMFNVIPPSIYLTDNKSIIELFSI